MPISPFIPGGYKATQSSYSLINTRFKLEDLQRQLTTGKKSETFGGLGIGRITSLDLRAKLSEVQGYRATITQSQIRIKQLDLGLDQLGKISGDLRANTIAPQYDPDAAGFTTMQKFSRLRLDEAVDVLNTEINGVRLYSGRSSDIRPVVDVPTLLNGDATGRAGVLQLVAERKAADFGLAPNEGRVIEGGAGSTATLTEDGAHPFGFKLSAASSTSPGITATFTAGAPVNINFNVTALPTAGEQVRFQLTMPDGTKQDINLTARTGPTVPVSDAGGFDIGATPAATGANLRAAIDAAIGREAVTTLPATSAKAAADAFFAGSNSAPPQRVVGPPATATLLAAGTPANTVIWYKGDDTSLNARQTSLAKVDSGVSIGLGVQANEKGIARFMANLVVFSTETFNAANANDQGRYRAMTDRMRTDLSQNNGVQTVQTIQIEISMASSTIKLADDRHRTKLGFMQDTLSGVEDADDNETSVKILSLQTKLQASYQVTSILSKLNLTDYLR
jgi:flagellar hook-associated protein 3 FlgL